MSSQMRRMSSEGRSCPQPAYPRPGCCMIGERSIIRKPARESGSKRCSTRRSSPKCTRLRFHVTHPSHLPFCILRQPSSNSATERLVDNSLLAVRAAYHAGANFAPSFSDPWVIHRSLPHLKCENCCYMEIAPWWVTSDSDLQPARFEASKPA